MRMNLTLIIASFLVLILGCKLPITGKIIADVTSSTNTTTKQLVDDTFFDPLSSNTTQPLQKELKEQKQKTTAKPSESCEQKVERQQQLLEDERYTMMVIEGRLRRAGLEAVYLKKAQNKEEQYKAKLEEVDRVSEEKKDTQARLIKARTDLKELASKCNIRIKLDKD